MYVSPVAAFFARSGPALQKVVDEIAAKAVDQAVAAMGCMLEQFREEMLAPNVAWLQLERRVQELEAAAAEQGARQSRQAEEDVAMGPTPAAEELFLELLRHGNALAAAGLTDDGSTLSEFFLDKRRTALNQLFGGGGGCGPPPLLSPAPAPRAAPQAPTSPWQDAVP